LWAMAAHIGAAMHAAFEELSGSGAGSGEQLAQPSEEQPDAQEAMVVNPPQPMPESGPAGVPMPTPGMNLASIFSPSGDDLFAACGMFVSPEDRLPAAGEATNADRPRQLFTEDEEHETRDGDVQLTKRDSFTFHP